MDEILDVIGLGFYTSKNGVQYRIIHTTQAFTDSKYGIGLKTSQEFVKKDYCPAGLAPGCKIRFTYGRNFKGEAYVNGVHIVEEDVPTISTKK